jgi:2-keto-4-pentenoate hydratase/2-oxohepta-3-ene-1,7-dioic acid hydratase in catechol pathway
MRWIRFTAEDRTRYGILEGDRILEVSGSPFDGYEKTSRKHDIAAVKIEVPVIPRTFYCAGLNYVEHVKEGAAKRGEVPNIPSKPDMGYRASNALIAHGETVIIPADATEKIHYEGEVVAVIGKKAKNLSEAEALNATAPSGVPRIPIPSSPWALGLKPILIWKRRAPMSG